jgi:hypothetical protein
MKDTYNVYWMLKLKMIGWRKTWRRWLFARRKNSGYYFIDV